MILAINDRRAPHRSDRADDLRHYFGELTNITPPTNAERAGQWYVKAARIGYLITGRVDSPPRKAALPSPPGSGLAGVEAPSLPGLDYEDELTEGFALKYGG